MRGMDVNTNVYGGRPPLFVASEYKKIHIVKYLIDNVVIYQLYIKVSLFLAIPHPLRFTYEFVNLLVSNITIFNIYR